MSSKVIGTCEDCTEQRRLVAKGLCSSCYQRQLKTNVTPPDCFALDLHKRDGQCSVMQGKCRMMQGLPCPFHKTKANHIHGRLTALERIASLPPQRQEDIRKTYWTQNEAEKQK